VRSTDEAASVRLYHLDGEIGTAETLMYGTLAEAMRAAAAQPQAVQAGLFPQTDNDVVAYLDLIEG